MKRLFFMILFLIVLSALAVLPCAGEGVAGTYGLFLHPYDIVTTNRFLDPYVYVWTEDTGRMAVWEGVRDWAISDTNVVAFSTERYDATMKTVGYGKATISVTAPDGTRLSKEIEVVPAPTYVMLDRRTVTLNVGESVQLHYATDRQETEFVWQESSVAGVDENGLVTARAPGTGAVRVISSLDYEVTCACTIIVRDTEDDDPITISPQTNILPKGASIQLRVTDKDGNPVQATFSKDPENLHFNVTEDGLVTALNDRFGAVITATDSRGRKAELPINCVPSHDEIRQIYGFFQTVGETDQITVNGRFPQHGEFTFISSNPSILSFHDDQGLFYTCYRPGTVTITAISNFTGAQGSWELHVSGYKGIKFLDQDYTYLRIGDTFKLPKPRDMKTGKQVSCKYYSNLPKSVSVGKTSGLVKAKAVYMNSESDRLINQLIIYAVDSRGCVAEYYILLVLPPESISITRPDNGYMIVGETFDIQSRIFQHDLENSRDPQFYPDGMYDIQYASSDPTVATVDQNGRITAVGSGEVVITGSLMGIEDSAYITVGAAEPEWVKMRFGDLEIGLGESFRLDMRAPIFSPGASSDYRYASGDSNILVCSNKQNVIYGMSVGSTDLILRTYNGKEDRVRVTVKRSPTQIDLSETNIRLALGEVRAIRVLLPEGESGAFSLYTSQNDIILHDVPARDTALIAGIQLGTVDLTFMTYNNIRKTVTVEVVPGPKSVSLGAKKRRVAMDETYTFTPTFKGNPTSCIFASSKPEIATIDENGTLTPVAPGATVVSVLTGNGKTAKCTVTVYQRATQIDLSANVQTVSLGKKITLKPTVLPANTEKKSVTWRSADKTIATVTKKGQVTGKRVGTVEIIATAADGSGVEGAITIAVLPLPAQMAIYPAPDADTPFEATTTVQLSDKNELPLFVRVLPENADPAVTWTSSNKKLATVGADGIVRFKGKTGTVTIKATSKMRKKTTASLKITIAPAPPKSEESIAPPAVPQSEPETPQDLEIITSDAPASGDIVPIA